jgi:hypothetical protein
VGVDSGRAARKAKPNKAAYARRLAQERNISRVHKVLSPGAQSDPTAQVHKVPTSGTLLADLMAVLDGMPRGHEQDAAVQRLIDEARLDDMPPKILNGVLGQVIEQCGRCQPAIVRAHLKLCGLSAEMVENAVAEMLATEPVLH